MKDHFSDSHVGQNKIWSNYRNILCSFLYKRLSLRTWLSVLHLGWSFHGLFYEMGIKRFHIYKFCNSLYGLNRWMTKVFFYVDTFNINRYGFEYALLYWKNRAKIQNWAVSLHFHMRNQLADLTSLQGSALLNLSLWVHVYEKKKKVTDVQTSASLSLWVYCPLKLEFVYNASTTAVQSHKTPQQCSQNGLFWLMISSQWKMLGSRGSRTERKKKIFKVVLLRD